LIIPEIDFKTKIAGFLMVVANECKLESCPGLIRPIYILSLVTVAKTNPPSFDKRWRYRVLPLSFCQSLSLINTDVCVEFYEILNILSASKSPEKNIEV